jgi:GNAT superfamily N-acetyltransferase
MAEDPEAVALVAEDGRGVVGFATGVPSVGAFYRRFGLRHGLPAALAAAPSLVRPGVLARVLETARYPAAASSLPPSELLSIAVDPRCRQAGVGRALAEAVVEGLARRGAREVKVVVGADNDAANRFYARLGFSPGPRIAVHRGAPSTVWIRRCPSLSP